MSESSDASPPPVPHPFGELIGMVVQRTGVGAAEARLTVGPDHLNPHGVLHGAVLFALIDTSMGGAAVSVLADGKRPVTIEIQTRFLRPGLAGSVRCEATVVKPGSRVVHLEARVMGDDGKLVATGTGSFAVV
jgi:acyl-CoA thioesterase